MSSEIKVSKFIIIPSEFVIRWGNYSFVVGGKVNINIIIFNIFSMLLIKHKTLSSCLSLKWCWWKNLEKIFFQRNELQRFCSYMLRIAADVVALKAEYRKVFNIVRVYSAPANAKNSQSLCRRNQTSLYVVFIFEVYKNLE